MDALTRPPTPEASPAAADMNNINEEAAASSTGAPTASDTGGLSTKKGSRKRSRETTLTDKPYKTPGSPPQSPPKGASDERASKKAKGYSWEQEAEAIITSRCMENLEVSLIQAGRSPFSAYARKFYAKSLTVLLRHLKSASPEGYSTTLSKVSTAHDDWIILRRKQAEPSYQRTSDGLVAAQAQAQTRVIDAISALLDPDRLIKLHPYLIGNPRLQIILRDLQFPLHKLKMSASELHHVQQNTDAELQRQAAIKDLLVWLSPQQAWSRPEGPSYNDTVARNKQEIVMRVELDQGKTSQIEEATLQANDGQAAHLRENAPVTITKLTDSTPECKSQFEELKDLIVKNQSETWEMFNAYISSQPDVKPQPLQSETTHGDSTKVETRDNDGEMSTSTSPQTTQDQQLDMRGLEVEAILTAARAEPYQNARADIEQQNLSSLMKFAKLQNWGSSYNIVINQLIGAAAGGPPPTFLDALQMPDNNACYYRLQDLWLRIGEILQKYDDFNQLLVNANKCYDFAICVREVHCLLRLVHYRGGTYADILATGWDVEKVRRLQTMMVAYMREEPLVWSKPDVDAICNMLQIASNQNSVDHGKPTSFAARVAAAAAHEMIMPNNARQPVHRPQMTKNNQVQHGELIYVPTAPAAPVNSIAGHPVPQAQITVPAQQSTQSDDAINAMDIEDAPLPAQPQYQADLAVSIRDPEAELDMYCKNYLKKKGCRGCNRKHEKPPPWLVALAETAKASRNNELMKVHTDNPPKETMSQSQAGRSRKICTFFAAGRCTKGKNCTYSHDPANFAANGLQFPVGQQRLGDITMDGAASTGDNRAGPAATTQNDIHNTRCQYEKNNKFCNNRNCKFLHLNPQSKNFLGNGRQPDGKNQGRQTIVGQQQQGNSQRRASNNFTYDPAVHGTNLGAFLPSQQPQTQQNTQAWVGDQTRPHPAQGLMLPPPVPARGNGNNTPNGGNVQGQGPQCYICKQFGHKQGNCPSAMLNADGAGTQQGGNQRHGNQGVGNHGSGNQRAGNCRNGPQGGGNRQGGDGGFTGNCRSCGGQGHKAVNCPNNAGQQGGFRGQYAQSTISAL